jgi:hypothetical protein
MKFPTLRSRFGKTVSVVLLLVVLTTSASAAALPTLGTRLYYILGNILHGGMIQVGSTSLNTTSVAGAVEVLPEFATATTLRPVTNSTSQGFPYKGKFNAYVRGGTGSSTVRYAASCFKNPFQNMSGGTGVALVLDYHAGNTNGHGGDIGFVDSCTDNTTSGSDLIDNTCTATGCISSYRTGTAIWHGAKYIKFTPRGKLGSVGGRITGEVINVWAE